MDYLFGINYLSTDGHMSLDLPPDFALFENDPALSNSSSRALQTDSQATTGQSNRVANTRNILMSPPIKERKKKAQTLKADVWEPYKTRILDLHITQKLPLPEVKRQIESEFGFKAELRQYRTRISQWGRDKNVKPNEMKAIVRKRQQRRLLEDKGDLQFTIRGAAVEPQKIERWMKRNEVPESFLYAPSPAASTPSAVGCRTISEIGSPISTPSYSAASPYFRPGTPRALAQSHVPSVLPSLESSIASIVRNQGSSFAGQSPAHIHRSLPNANTLAVPTASCDIVLPLTASQATKASSGVWYKESEENHVRQLISVIVRAYWFGDHQKVFDYSFRSTKSFMQQSRSGAAEIIARNVLKEIVFSGNILMRLLPSIYKKDGQLQEAEELLLQIIMLQRSSLSQTHPDLQESIGYLATVHTDQGRFEETVKALEKLIGTLKKMFGE